MSTKISQLTSAVDVTANDLIQIVDVEDGVMAPSGTNKKATASLLAKELAKQPLEPGVVISGSSSNDAVRITQTGTGNALVVEDSTNPDATPFVVNNQGFVLVGDTTSRTGPYGYQRGLQLTNQGTQLTAVINNQYGESITFAKGRGTPSSPHTIVQSGDALGSIAFTGSDGSDYVLGSQISSFVDAVPGSGDMPSCLAFATSSDGTTNAAERMRITSAGNVGIGTSSPIDKLTVNGPIAISPATTNYGSEVVDVANRTNTYLTFQGATGQSDWAYLRQIGTGDNDLTIALDLHDDLNAPTGSQAFTIRKVGSAANPDLIQTNFMVNSSGNVGIGTSSPESEARMDVNGVSILRSDTLGFSILAPKYNTPATGVNWDRFELRVDPLNQVTYLGNTNGGTGQARDLALIAGSSGEKMRITSAGNVGIGMNSPSYQLQLSLDSAAKPSTSTWTVSSDERLKENIEAADLDICYNAVKNIPLKRYKWKDEIYSAEQVADRSKIGWIAQDVQAVFPKAVGQHKFVYNQVKDEEGNIVSEDSIDDCLSLNSDQLYAALFGAVQKLMGEVESLQDRIAELESAP